ncbi:MAG: response regulator [Cyanobacteriota bacterium]|jgi:chemotaxis protein histidine kinase CheA/DNA-binding response OmpR family regulator
MQNTPSASSDNWFDDDENADFLSALDGLPTEAETPTEELGSLMDWLEDEPSSPHLHFSEANLILEEEDAPSPEDPPQRMTLSLTNNGETADSLAELESLFADEAQTGAPSLDPYETSSWLEIDDLMEQSETPSPSAVTPGELAELEDWFSEAEAEIDMPPSDFADPPLVSASFETQIVGEQEVDHTRTLPESELEELRELLGVGFFSAEEPVAPAPRVPEPVLSAQPLPLLFYDALETWDALLAAPPHPPQEETADFAALAALIEASPQMGPTPVGTPVFSAPAPPRPAVASLEIEDDFKDLEALLEQADRMGGPPTLVSVGGQRLAPRNRPAKSKSFEQTMRVPVKQLDNLSNLIGELVVKRNRLEQDQERLRQFLDNLLNQTQNLSDVGGRMQDLYERTLLEGALLASRHTSSRQTAKLTYPGEQSTFPGVNALGDQHLDALEMDRFTGFHLLSQEMIELIVRVRESASDIQYLVDETDQVARTLRQVTTQLQEGMTQSRMVPFAQTADRLPRAVREVSLKLNKKVNLEVDGRDVLIDKMILEHLYNPMTHLVNNAITHGIESPAERQKRGKPAEGNLTIKAFLQGNQTLIIVSDDGAGIDSQRVKQKAIEKGLISPLEAQGLSEQDVYDLLFHAGFSTKDKADDFAGRGVGLDVVRTSLLDIRGSVSIDSALGQGTTFSIRLPLTLSISKALCCLCDRARIAFPMDGVEDTKDFLPTDLVPNEDGKDCIPWNGALLPVQPLGELLSYNRLISRGSVYGGKPEDDIVAMVILRGGNNLLAVRVDQVLGEEEIVIKQIEGPVPKPPGVAGATVRGDGSIMPIGDVLELIEISQGRLRTDGSSGLWRKTLVPVANDLQMEPTVLIVDDSITVRELLSLSFTKAGYRVEQARDGQEAWEQLRSGLPCDLVFCDIEMPRMNGLELLSQLQTDENLAMIPVALLTSRGADRHRKVAAQLGASGYFTKPYTEKDILDAASRMIQGEILLPGSAKQPQSVLSRFKKVSATSPGEISPSAATVEVDRTPRVLIIDDSVMVREMLSLTFRKAGYITDTARDGQDAWEKLTSGLPCDLILCDIEMPRMNGLELLGRIQEDKQLTKIPVAMITSRGAQKMQRLAAEKGAKGYFVKPYIEEALLESSQRLLRGEVLLDINALGNDG